MRPELVQFHDEYEDRMIVQSLNISKFRSGMEGFPVTLLPTQFIFNADGTPYLPKSFSASTMYELVVDENDNHILTKRVGLMTYDEMVAIYDDIVGE
jgi:thioredoxin 1